MMESMFEEATSFVDDMIGGGSDPGAKQPGPPAEYERRESLADDQKGGSVALEDENKLEQAAIDFVHFGRVHQDEAADFNHGELDDRIGELQCETEGHRFKRGIQFRAAVQRETLMLHQMVKGTQEVITSYEDSKGGLGELADAAMSMVTGDSAEDQAPEAAELAKHLEEIEQAGGYANQKDIEWVDLHLAGKDLHQYRSDHQGFCERVYKYHFEEGDSGDGGVLGGLGGDMLGDVMPGMVPDGVKTVQGIIFKAFDIYVAQFLKAREKLEPLLEDSAYGMTLKALQNDWRPVYPIWFPQPPYTPPAEKEEEEEEKKKNAVEEAIEDVKEKIDEAKKKAEEAKQKVTDTRDEIMGFLGAEEDPPTCNGTDALAAIFAELCPDPEAVGKKPIHSTFVMAFEEALGFEIPDFIKDVIKRLCDANVGLLKRVYNAIMLGRAQTPIDAPAMALAGREELADTLINTAIELIGVEDFFGREFLNMKGVGKFGGEEIKNMAARYLDQGLGEYLGKLAEVSSGELAPILEAARKAGGEDGAAMEALLGRLPQVLALQFRNTFFPLVDLVLDAVFGAIGGPLSKVASTITGGIADVKNAVKGTADDAIGEVKGVHDDVMEKKNEAEQKAKDIQENLKSVSSDEIAEKGLKDTLLGSNSEDEEEEQKTEEELVEGPPPAWPATDADREFAGIGKPVTAEQADEVDAQQAEMKIVTGK